jgi:programmed cell death 6-interacting protein
MRYDIIAIRRRDCLKLPQAMDILDSEASEDEAARSAKHLTRQPSHLANQELTSKGERYRRILTEAQDSDEHVRQKWDESETNIRSLTWDEVSFFIDC